MDVLVFQLNFVYKKQAVSQTWPWVIGCQPLPSRNLLKYCLVLLGSWYTSWSPKMVLLEFCSAHLHNVHNHMQRPMEAMLMHNVFHLSINIDMHSL